MGTGSAMFEAADLTALTTTLTDTFAPLFIWVAGIIVIVAAGYFVLRKLKGVAR